jgi:hypothetical protein
MINGLATVFIQYFTVGGFLQLSKPE